MRRLVLTRLLLALPLLVVVSGATFVLDTLAPGDPARQILGNRFDPDRYALLRTELGLDRPLPVRYADWLAGAVRGDLGTSAISGLDVTDLIGSRLGVTVSLVVGATLVAGVAGIALGVVGATRRGAAGRVVDGLSVAGLALPSFWLGLALASLFAVTLGLFPATGYVRPGTSVAGWLHSLVLPVLTLAAAPTAVIAKQTREAVAEVGGREFVRVLRTRGYSARRILFAHILPNAAIPVTTVLGLLVIGLLSGSVLVENVFALPGLGGLAVQSSLQGDFPVVAGVAVTFGLAVVASNLVIDVAYGWLNPKVRIA